LDYKDWVINATVEFISMIKMHNYQGLKFVPKIFEGETHISVLSTALHQWFEDYILALALTTNSFKIY